MANTTIQVKRSGTPSSVPSSLNYGELAINYADGLLFYKNLTNQIVSISSGSNSFGTVNANGTLVVADTTSDVLNLVAGTNITFTVDTVTDSITINGSGGTGDVTAPFNAANAAFLAANSAFNKANTAGSNTEPGILQMANTYNYRQKSNTQLVIGLTDAWNAVRTVSLSPNTTLNIDMTSGINFNVTLNASTTITPTNTANSIGQTGVIRLKQNASGGSLASYHVDFDFANGTAPILSTAANREDFLFYYIVDANRVFATLQKAVS